MKTRTFLLGIMAAGIAGYLLLGCSGGSPGNAVRAAMEKELIKEKAMEYLEEHDVPAVVIKEFNNRHSDTITRQWLAYKKTPGERINLELPEVYVVNYNVNDQGFSEKYSNEGEIIETNRTINLSVLPNKASDLLQKGEYKNWEVSGDVLELLDNLTNEPVGYLVTVAKSDNKERIFFDRTGHIVKIQKLG